MNEIIVFSRPDNRRPFPMLHIGSRQKDNSIIISGCYPNHKWAKDQIIQSDHPYLKPTGGCIFFKVEEVIEQRDYSGIFDEEWKKKDSFFKIKMREIPNPSFN